MHAAALPPRQHRRPAFLVVRVRSGGGAGSGGCSGPPGLRTRWPWLLRALAASLHSPAVRWRAGGCELPALGVGVPASRPIRISKVWSQDCVFLCFSSWPFPHRPRPVHTHRRAWWCWWGQDRRGLGQSWVGGAEWRTGLAASPASVLGGLTSVILFNSWMQASVLSL